MSMEVKNGVFELPIEVEAAGQVTKVLATADKYLDKNIKVVVDTPAVKFNEISGGEVTAAASVVANDFTSDTVTPYAIIAKADAEVAATELSVKTPGFASASDGVQIAKANAESATKTTYIKAGTLTSSGSASATSDSVKMTEGSSASDGFVIKASAAGGAKVTVGGWIPANTTATGSGDAYYEIQAASLANTATAGESYTESNAPVLTENGYLFINEGYIAPTKISLATLVPDDANITNENADLVYNTVKAYNKDGKLIVGTMGDAALGAITANDATANIGTVNVAAAQGGGFEVTGSASISGNTSVSVATRGLAETSLSKSGVISGTASVNATIPTVSLGVNVADNDLKVTPVIGKENSTAKSGAITTTAPTGRYVAVSAAAISASTNVTPTVTAAGYGTSAHNSAAGALVTAGSEASGTYYIPMDSAAHTAVASDPTVVNATAVVSSDVSASTHFAGNLTAGILSAAPSSGEYLKIDATATPTAGSLSGTVTCTATEGYIEAGQKTASISGNVAVNVTAAGSKYIRIYGGEFVEGE